jgi:hypothetical protein
MTHLVRIAAFSATIAVAAPAIPASSATNGGAIAAVPYVAAFSPVFAGGLPYAGTMNLIMRDGSISGTYAGISVRPDRLDDRISPVHGTIGSDGAVHFRVGNALSFTGELENDGTISGTAEYEGRLCDFLAKPGSPAR